MLNIRSEPQVFNPKFVNRKKVLNMRCEQFKSRFINIEHMQLDEAALSHLGSCASCKSTYESTLAVLTQLEQAKCPSFNPYFTEKVMGKISHDTPRLQSNSIRYALIVSVVVTFLIGGLTVYIAHSKNQSQQYDMLSLNDITKVSVTFEK
jgi:predicted anti-sigma-YlaC factor YlaD